MKVRNGFVSNSSSSSFLIALAKVADPIKFRESFKQFKDSINLVCARVKDIPTTGWYVVVKDDKNIVVDSFQCDVSIPLDKLKDDDEIVAYSFEGNEGDSAFQTGSDEYECIYNIDSTFFDDPEYAIIQKFSNAEKNGIELVQLTYGAGRNG